MQMIMLFLLLFLLLIHHQYYLFYFNHYFHHQMVFLVSIRLLLYMLPKYLSPKYNVANDDVFIVFNSKFVNE